MRALATLRLFEEHAIAQPLRGGYRAAPLARRTPACRPMRFFCGSLIL